MDLIDPFPEQPAAEGRVTLSRQAAFLTDKVDADQIDREGEIPAEVTTHSRQPVLRHTIPRSTAGQLPRCRTTAIEMVAAHAPTRRRSLRTSRSASRSRLLFGTDEQKKRYLPRLARARLRFALTEPNAGSDPANMTTRAELADGKEGS